MLQCWRALRPCERRINARLAARVRRPSYQSSRWSSAFRPTTALRLRQEREQTSRLERDATVLAGSHEQSKRGRASTTDKGAASWELTVGIEIHAQLNSTRKLFSRATTSIDDEPNSHVAIFDAALPGSQPVFQKEVLLPALRAALALDCDVQQTSRFDRKHYFYRDQPAGYQITQYYEPLALDGKIRLFQHDGIDPADGESITIGIKQIQMEQDTAKTVHRDSTCLLDFNRVGTPLIEIITMPHMHSPATAAACVRKIHGVLKTVGACVLGMDVGGLRADVNVSVKPRRDAPGGLDEDHHHYHGVTGLGQRTEIKNLSSYKAIEDAIKAERDRQIAVLEGGGKVEGETRGWSLGSTQTTKLRGKEGEVDYRYMPDADLGPVILSEELVAHLRHTLPTLPDQLLETLTSREYDLTIKDAKTLVALDDGDRLDYFYEVVDIVQRALPTADAGITNATIGRTTGNWVLHELGGLLASTDKDWHENPVSVQALADIVTLLLTRKITGRTAKRLLQATCASDARSIPQIVEDDDLWYTEMSAAAYEALAREVMAEHAKEVWQIREQRKMGKVQFLVGRMVRRSGEGTVDAKEAREVLMRLLSDSSTQK